MGYTMMVAVLPLTAEDLLGSARWSGAPSALGTLGVAFGSSWIASHMRRRSRRTALALGYLLSTVAAGVAAAGAASAAFLLMAGAVFFVGAGPRLRLLDKTPGGNLWTSAHAGFAYFDGPQFGIVGVDRTTQMRTPKPSAYWLGAIARANRFDPSGE